MKNAKKLFLGLVTVFLFSLVIACKGNAIDKVLTKALDNLEPTFVDLKSKKVSSDISPQLITEIPVKEGKTNYTVIITYESSNPTSISHKGVVTLTLNEDVEVSIKATAMVTGKNNIKTRSWKLTVAALIPAPEVVIESGWISKVTGKITNNQGYYQVQDGSGNSSDAKVILKSVTIIGWSADAIFGLQKSEIIYIMASESQRANIVKNKVYDLTGKVQLYYGLYELMATEGYWQYQEVAGATPETISPTVIGINDYITSLSTSTLTDNTFNGSNPYVVKYIKVEAVVSSGTGNYTTLLIDPSYDGPKPDTTAAGEYTTNALMIYYRSNLSIIQSMDTKTITVPVIAFTLRTNNAAVAVCYIGDGSDIELPGATPEELLALAKGSLSLSKTSFVASETIVFPTVGANNVAITWDYSDSENPDNNLVNLETGLITLPPSGIVNVGVVATLSLSGYTETKEFNIQIINNIALPFYQGFASGVTGGNGYATTSINLWTIKEVMDNSDASDLSDPENTFGVALPGILRFRGANTAHLYNVAAFDQDVHGVQFDAKAYNSSHTAAKLVLSVSTDGTTWTAVYDKATYGYTTFETVDVPIAQDGIRYIRFDVTLKSLNLDNLYIYNSDPSSLKADVLKVKEAKSIRPKNGEDIITTIKTTDNITMPQPTNGVTIVWEGSSHISSTGVITLPDKEQSTDTIIAHYYIGDKEIDSLGFKIVVVSLAQQAEDNAAQAFTDAKAALVIEKVTFTETEEGALILPTTAATATVTWDYKSEEEPNKALVNLTNGNITIPAEEGNATIIIVATLTIGGATQTKEFSILVKHLPANGGEPELTYIQETIFTLGGKNQTGYGLTDFTDETTRVWTSENTRAQLNTQSHTASNKTVAIILAPIGTSLVSDLGTNVSALSYDVRRITFLVGTWAPGTTIEAGSSIKVQYKLATGGWVDTEEGNFFSQVDPSQFKEITVDFPEEIVAFRFIYTLNVDSSLTTSTKWAITIDDIKVFSAQ